MYLAYTNFQDKKVPVLTGCVHVQVPDFLNAHIGGEPAIDVVKDEHWFEHDFTPTVIGRGKQSHPERY